MRVLKIPNFLKIGCHEKLRILLKFLSFQRKPIMVNYKNFQNFLFSGVLILGEKGFKPRPIQTILWEKLGSPRI